MVEIHSLNTFIQNPQGTHFNHQEGVLPLYGIWSFTCLFRL